MFIKRHIPIVLYKLEINIKQCHFGVLLKLYGIMTRIQCGNCNVDSIEEL